MAYLKPIALELKLLTVVVSVVRNRRRRYLLVVRCKDWDNLDKAEEIAKKHANGHMALKGMTPHGAEGSSTDNDRNNDRNKDAGREMEADWEITFQDSGKKKDKNKGKRTQKQSRTNGQTAESGTPGEPKQSHSPERQLLQELQKLEGVSASLVGFNGSYAV